VVSVMLAVLLAGGCASTGAKKPQAPPRSSAPQAEKGDALGIVGADTPPLLKQVQAAPYSPPKSPECAAIAQEIAALDQVLGPDVDAVDRPDDGAVGRFLSGTIRGLVPYRGVMRFLAGASKRDKAFANAVLAGAARRGFLKGISQSMGCWAPASDRRLLQGPPPGL